LDSAVLREGSTLEQLAFGLVYRGDGDRRLVWGSTPIRTFMGAHTSVSVGSLSSCGVREGHSYYFLMCIYLFRVTPPAAFSTAGLVVVHKNPWN
jgi:hypothetical protein